MSDVCEIAQPGYDALLFISCEALKFIYKQKICHEVWLR